MVNPNKSIHLGLKINKYKTPTAIINILNDLIDKNLQNSELALYNHQLAGEIKGEWDIMKIIPIEAENFFWECTNNYVTNETHMLTKVKSKAQFNSCWINDQNEGEFNPVHAHHCAQRAGISSVLFLKVPDSISQAQQDYNQKEPPKAGRLEFIGSARHSFGRNQHLVHPNVGDLYIFPHELPHCVYPFKGEGVRRSLSFNVELEEIND